MRRNLDRRVEAVTPIEDPNLKAKIETILDIYLTDNINSWEMQSNGKFVRKQACNKKICAQTVLMVKKNKI